MTALFSILGIFSMLFAVGSIDGPTLETSGNNWVGCFIFAIAAVGVDIVPSENVPSRALESYKC